VTATTLFVHSTGTFPSMWQDLPKEVLGDTFALTPSNLGYPPNPPFPRGTETFASDDAKVLLSKLPADGPIDLVGHSYGGLVILRMLPVLGDRVRSVFLFEPVIFGALVHLMPDTEPAARALELVAHPGFFDDALGGTEPWLEHFIDYWNRPGSWARMPDVMRAPIREVGWKMYQEVRGAFFDLTGAPDRPLPPLPARTTLVMGERSPLEARAMVALLHRLNPHATLVDAKGIGHMAPMTHRKVVQELLADHRRRISEP
jgi:pimeloyl-ACP methyl ester carboxylesterase